jgi:23S rRNA-/tRNA-specific pseudouridylate synthase
VAGRAIPRLMLHARALAFPHPAGGRKRIEADPPPDMAQAIADLRLSAA